MLALNFHELSAGRHLRLPCTVAHVVTFPVNSALVANQSHTAMCGMCCVAPVY